jgi:hypothetical protein
MPPPPEIYEMDKWDYIIITGAVLLVILCVVL